MRLLLTTLLVCISLFAFAQPTQTIGNLQNIVKVPNDFTVDSIVKFSTVAKNPGEFNTDSRVLVIDTTTGQLKTVTNLLESSSYIAIDSIVQVGEPFRDSLKFYKRGILYHTTIIRKRDGLDFGGEVTAINDTTFSIATANYTLLGLEYIYPGGQTQGFNKNYTSLPYFGLIGVNSTGNTFQRLGNPSNVPVEPAIDKTQELVLTKLYFPENGGTPVLTGPVSTVDSSAIHTVIQVNDSTVLFCDLLSQTPCYSVVFRKCTTEFWKNTPTDPTNIINNVGTNVQTSGAFQAADGFNTTPTLVPGVTFNGIRYHSGNSVDLIAGNQSIGRWYLVGNTPGDAAVFSIYNNFNPASGDGLSAALHLSSGVFPTGLNTKEYAQLLMTPIYNQSTFGIGAISGIKYNPDVVELNGSAHYAWWSTSGGLRAENLGRTEDTTTYKPLGIDAAGNFIALDAWYGGSSGSTTYTFQNALTNLGGNVISLGGYINADIDIDGSQRFAFGRNTPLAGLEVFSNYADLQVSDYFNLYGTNTGMIYAGDLTLWGNTTTNIKGDVIRLNSPQVVIGDGIGGNLPSASDTTNSKPLTINPVTGEIQRLSSWVGLGGGGGSIDTTSLSNRINQKLNIADTVDLARKATEVIDAEYTGTVTWTGTTAPSGTPVNRYSWTQNGKTVVVIMSLYYPTNGTSITAATMTFPTDLPLPKEFTGLGAANDVLYGGMGYLTTNRATEPTVAGRAFIKVNAADNGYELKVVSSSVSARYVTLTITYTTP